MKFLAWIEALLTGSDLHPQELSRLPSVFPKIPETPDQRATLNGDPCRKHLKPGTGYFEPHACGATCSRATIKLSSKPGGGYSPRKITIRYLLADNPPWFLIFLREHYGRDW
jgi:hypothetical protein